MMVEICQKVLDGFTMPGEWTLSIVVPIFKGKGDKELQLFQSCEAS